MLELVEVFSDVDICSERDRRDEFFFVCLYAGVRVFLVVSVSTSICVRFALIEPVMRENV